MRFSEPRCSSPRSILASDSVQRELCTQHVSRITPASAMRAGRLRSPSRPRSSSVPSCRPPHERRARGAVVSRLGRGAESQASRASRGSFCSWSEGGIQSKQAGCRASGSRSFAGCVLVGTGFTTRSPSSSAVRWLPLDDGLSALARLKRSRARRTSPRRRASRARACGRPCGPACARGSRAPSPCRGAWRGARGASCPPRCGARRERPPR